MATPFLVAFQKVHARKVGGGGPCGKSLPADEFTWIGIYAGHRVILRTRPRQIDPRATFHISSNQRLRTSGHGIAEYVDVEVLEGNLVGSELEGLRELLQVCDTRPVVIRRRGEPVR